MESCNFSLFSLSE